MPEPVREGSPLADVRALIMSAPPPATEPGKQVREALLGMGREGDFGRLGEAAEWLRHCGPP